MAGSGGPVQDLCAEATCPICLDYFKDPVTTACGHDFCRGCLSRYSGVVGSQPSCPQCRNAVQPRSLAPNRKLANFVEITKKLSLQEGKWGVCEKHQEPLKLFCKEDQTPICVVCDRSREHENHKVIPLEEASREFKDMRGTLQSSEKMETSENPLALPPEPRSRALEYCVVDPVLDVNMDQFKANVTLDPDTAHPILILSEDLQSVRYGAKLQDLPSNPERFSQRPSVMGCEGFTAGRHFWEVVGASEEGWAVGVARKSVRRKNYFPLSPEGGIWAVGRWEGEYRACDPPNYSLLPLSGEPRKIRVALNYEGREVSFFEADTGAHLYTFSGASFSEQTLFPFFFLQRNETHLRIS
ncbi:finger RFP-like [Podarcis lilfordi]|uniref:Finger RFP-like n=1 Tax=Podarcis lilfordi TaxID=74358 RepID=A0AA35K0S4_9SAUR|nr:finger RFP-like [Podarcis lilfordi]